MNILEITLKLFLAVALGGLIGFERETSRKPAGLRTNILICVGATMIMVLSNLILQGKDGTGGEMARMAAGVITGIGFIGAGTIIQSKGSVTGLTTAATLWVVAGLGLVVGAGYYASAIIFTAVIILTLVLLGKLESHQLNKAVYHYHLKTKSSQDILMIIKKLALHEGIKFKEMSRKVEGNFFIIDFYFPASEEIEQKFKWGLLNIDDLLEIKIE